MISGIKVVKYVSFYNSGVQIPVYKVDSITTLAEATKNIGTLFSINDDDRSSADVLSYLSPTYAKYLESAISGYDEQWNPNSRPPATDQVTTFTEIKTVNGIELPYKEAYGAAPEGRTDIRAYGQSAQRMNSAGNLFFVKQSYWRGSTATVANEIGYQISTVSSASAFLYVVENGVPYYIPFSLSMYYYIKYPNTVYLPNISGSPGSNVPITLLGDMKGTNAYTEDYVKSIDGYKEDSPIINPYDPVGPSGPDGGGGTFDDTSDQIPDSTIPTLSSSNTGFTRIYNPTLAQVQQLAQYLWTDESVVQTIWNHIKQYFEDPMQAIIGFNLVPVSVPDGGTQEFKLMYIGTGVNMTVAASQFVDVDCGTYTVEKYYGSALDYAPYTKISCFLPFIGNVDLNPDEVMGATLQVKYRVDICSGSCVAKILVDGNCIYQYSGHCAIPIPLASADFSSYVSAAISVAKLAIGAAVAGMGGAGMMSAMEVGQATSGGSAFSLMPQMAFSEMGTRQIGMFNEMAKDASKASFSGLSPSNVSNTVGEIMGTKPNFQHSGSFSGNTGYLGVRRPYLIITRPNLCMPETYQHLNGYPCMMSLSLGECTGYTRVQQVELTGFTATNPEQAEILQLLKSGVIL